MPTNLPPDYFQIEKEFRAAKSTTEKIALLQEMISIVPKHKGTDHLRADLRRRLSKLEASTKARKHGSKRDSTFNVEREGAGQLALVGPPNTGKSALVAALTNATPEVGEAPYTTWTATPGMMPIENVQVQLIDTPSLNPDFVEPQLMDLVRRADMVLIVVDLQAFPIQQLEDTVALLAEQRIVPQHLQEGYDGQRRAIFLPVLVVVNKADDESLDEDYEVLCELLEGEWPLIPVSAETGRNLEQLKRVVYDRLEIMRIYAKPPGKDPDLNEPFVMKKGSTVEEFAASVHQDFFEKLKSTRVWGSAEFEGQLVGRDYVLQDGDIVELRI